MNCSRDPKRFSAASGFFVEKRLRKPRRQNVTSLQRIFLYIFFSSEAEYNESDSMVVKAGMISSFDLPFQAHNDSPAFSSTHQEVPLYVTFCAAPAISIVDPNMGF